MRIIVRHCLPWGNYKTQAIELDPTADVDILREKIQEKFGVSKEKQVLKFKRDGVTLKVIPGWTLSFYEIQDKSVLYLDDLDQQPNDENTNYQGIKMKGGYFAKLGILSKVEEEDEDEDGFGIRRKPSRVDSPALSGSVGSDIMSQTILSSGDEDTVPKDYERKKRMKFKDDLEKIIKEVKSCNLEKVKDIIQSLSDSEEERAIEAKKLVNEIGQAGWNALHYAIFLGYTDIVKELFAYGADPNIISKDGWTPLQLAIHRTNLDIMRIILKQDKVNINELTPKGTALHIAAKSGRIEFVQSLIELGADIMIKNEQGQLAFELASNEKVRQLIEQEAVRRKDTGEFKPPKTPLVKGWMYKRSEYLLQMNRRYFVLNPEEGTFIRFMKKEDYPDKPKEIIPLKDISSIRRMNAGSFYDKNLYYIQMLYNKRYILACKNEETANKWVTYMIQGVVYANYLEDKLKEEMNKNENESVVTEYIQQNTEEIELEDNSPVKVENGEKKANGYYEDAKMPDDRRREEGKTAERRRGDIDPQDQEDLNKLVDEKVNFNSFEILKVLGSGAFGKVYKVRKKDDGKIYALKALKKRNLILKNQLRYAITECNVLKSCNHPFVLGLHYAFQTPQYLYLVLDYCNGGDLSLHLAQRITFTEEEARFYIAELILAIEHLHSLNVIYRDLKPENILVAQDGHIKLADFGLSKEGIGDNDKALSFCGSPAYLSPEMLKNKGVGKEADIYGIGTVLYEMLVGNSPYYNDDIPKMYQNIRKAKLAFPKEMSEKARNLLLRLLDRDPTTRIGAKSKDEIKNDPFFEGLDWKLLAEKKIKPPKLDPVDDDDLDVPLANPRSVFQDYDYNEKNKTSNRVRNFTFVRK